MDSVPIHAPRSTGLETRVADSKATDGLVEGQWGKPIQGDPGTDELVSSTQRLRRDGWDSYFLPPVPVIRHTFLPQPNAFPL